MPTKKAMSPRDVASLARSHTEMAIRTLAGICASSQASESARIAAGNSLLDRGWGKALQNVQIEGEGLSINIVRFTDGQIGPHAHAVLEADDPSLALVEPTDDQLQPVVGHTEPGDVALDVDSAHDDDEPGL